MQKMKIFWTEIEGNILWGELSVKKGAFGEKKKSGVKLILY